MEERNFDQQNKSGGNNAVIFGTSSDDIEQGLHNGQFADDRAELADEKDQIVNEQEQNEVINSSSESYDERPTQTPVAADNTMVDRISPAISELDESVAATSPDKDLTDNAGKVSKAED